MKLEAHNQGLRQLLLSLSSRVPQSEFFFGTIGFRLGDDIRCLEPEAQNAVLSLEVAKIPFSNCPLGIKIPNKGMKTVSKFISIDIIFVQTALN